MNKRSCENDYGQYSYFISKTRKPTVVYWFHRPDCGHCRKMKKSWESFESNVKLLKKANIKTKKVNITEEPELARKFNVEYVPHIVKVQGTKKTVYKGDRTTKNLMSWAVKSR